MDVSSLMLFHFEAIWEWENYMKGYFFLILLEPKKY